MLFSLHLYRKNCTFLHKSATKMRPVFQKPAMKISVYVKKRPNKDGKLPLYVCVAHKGERRYLATPLAIDKGKYRDGQIKDAAVMGDMLLHQIAPLEKKAEKIDTVQLLSMEELMEELTGRNKVERIDFLAFADDYARKIFAREPKSKTATAFRTAISSLRDFRPEIYTDQINLPFLESYASYLRSERKVKRPGRNGTVQTMTLPPLSNQSLFSAMKEFRTLFNACRKFYNDEDLGKIAIPNYPFARFRFPKVAEGGSEKAVALEDLKKVIGYAGDKTPGFARDMFLLSFYLVGMNPSDLYEASFQISDNRISYNRKKTRTRRSDRAHISIAIPDEALAIMDKYRQPLGEREYRWQNYADVQGLIRAVGRGLKAISADLGIPHFTWYSARHTWATLARNECGYPIDDVAFALNHSSGRVTDRYIRKDYSIIDRMNAKVIALTK